MSKFKYVHFGDDVPKDIERAYNRMLRKEKYQEERDKAHCVYFLKYDPLLSSVADITLTDEYQRELEAEERWDKRKAMLPKALIRLKKEYPDEYKLIMDYYYSDTQITLNTLAKQYGISKQAISKRMTAIRERLKSFIAAYEQQC